MRRFQHPLKASSAGFRILIAGTQNSLLGGKSFWLAKLLNADQIQPSPKKIIFIYCYWAPLYGSLRESLPNIEFVQSIPENIDHESFTGAKISTLIIKDDMMTCLNKGVLSLFTRGTHHLNRSVVVTVQNVFHQSTVMRTINLNSHYLVIWKQPRDTLQIEMLARQVFPRQIKFFMTAYKSATDPPFGYLFFDFRISTPSDLRLRTNVLQEGLLELGTVYRILPGKMEIFLFVPERKLRLYLHSDNLNGAKKQGKIRKRRIEVEAGVCSFSITTDVVKMYWLLAYFVTN